MSIKMTRCQLIAILPVTNEWRMVKATHLKNTPRACPPWTEFIIS